MRIHIRISKDTACMSSASPPDPSVLLSLSLMKTSVCTEILRLGFSSLEKVPQILEILTLKNNFFSFSPAPVSQVCLSLQQAAESGFSNRHSQSSGEGQDPSPNISNLRAKF